MTPPPAAVLWDMDGTLVDTEPYWIDTESELAAQYGAEWTHADAMNLVGSALIDSGRYIVERMRIPMDPAEVVEYLLAGVTAKVEEEVPWRPGARELLADLAAAGVPCGLVTMSYRQFVDPIVAELPAGSFGAVVTGDGVTHGKPHPEPYLKGAARLGVSAEQCLAIEDSNTGARSAESAGCAVLVVPNHVPVLEGPSRVHRETLTELDVDELVRIYREVHA